MDKDKREQEKPKPKKATHHRVALPPFLEDPFRQRALILAVLSLCMAFLITPSFTVSSPHFQLGEIADRNIKAKQDFLVEDEGATAKKREEAVRQAPIVYDLDDTVARQAQMRLQTAFSAMREYLTSNTPAADTQPSLTLTAKPPNPASALDAHDGTLQAISRKKELETVLGFQVPAEMFSILLDKRFSTDLENHVNQLVQSAFEQGIVSDKTWLHQVPGDNLVVIRKAGSQDEHFLPPPTTFPDLDEARQFVRMQALDQGKDAKEMMVIAFLVSELLQPNLSFNLQETELRREQAYASVKPVFIQLMRNEMLVREGQRIGPEEMLKLSAHEQAKPSRHAFLVFLAILCFSGLCVWVVVNVAKQHLPSHRMEVQDYIFLGTLLLLLLALGRATLWVGDFIGESSIHVTGKTFIYAIPLATGAMMASIFFGVTVSLIFSLLLTLFTGMLFGNDFGLFMYFLIGSFVAAHGVSLCRTRMVPIKAGVLVGCANAVLIILGALLHEDHPIFMNVLMNTFFGMCGGIFAGILVTGLTPLVEMGFGYTTDIKLLELATMDQPLLQELMVQAPGTYHHSIIVGNMVEAAAKSIGANSLLAKVAAYYHDIGKIRKPTYFIENQFDCENRHEKLAPSMSSLILISHVKEGVELARQHRLGQRIIDIISQHHGKSLISFFFNKALDAREKSKLTKGAELPPIDIDDYRYPGPKPQTKEAGLVMLADVVEAACRSLTDPTPARIQGMVNRLVNNIFSDGQLENCELTLKDLHQIAKHFNQILATVHHKRIEYPSVSSSEGKVKVDASDSAQRESKPDRDKPCANRELGRTDLKRLGIH